MKNRNILPIMLLSFLGIGNCYATLDVEIEGDRRVSNGSKNKYTATYARDNGQKSKAEIDKPSFKWGPTTFSGILARSEPIMNKPNQMHYFVKHYVGSKLPTDGANISCHITVKNTDDEGNETITIFYK